MFNMVGGDVIMPVAMAAGGGGGATVAPAKPVPTKPAKK
jgi:hypothetical protein